MSEKSKHKSAMGLCYQAGQSGAPILSVKEDNRYADQVVKIARRYGIPVVHKPKLACALKTLELDEEINHIHSIIG